MVVGVVVDDDEVVVVVLGVEIVVVVGAGSGSGSGAGAGAGAGVVEAGAVVVESSMATASVLDLVLDSEPAAGGSEQAVISSIPPTRTSIGCQRTLSR